MISPAAVSIRLRFHRTGPAGHPLCLPQAEGVTVELLKGRVTAEEACLDVDVSGRRDQLSRAYHSWREEGIDLEPL